MPSITGPSALISSLALNVKLMHSSRNSEFSVKVTLQSFFTAFVECTWHVLKFSDCKSSESTTRFTLLLFFCLSNRSKHFYRSHPVASSILFWGRPCTGVTSLSQDRNSWNDFKHSINVFSLPFTEGILQSLKIILSCLLHPHTVAFEQLAVLLRCRFSWNLNSV